MATTTTAIVAATATMVAAITCSLLLLLLPCCCCCNCLPEAGAYDGAMGTRTNKKGRHAPQQTDTRYKVVAAIHRWHKRAFRAQWPPHQRVPVRLTLSIGIFMACNHPSRAKHLGTKRCMGAHKTTTKQTNEFNTKRCGPALHYRPA